MSDLPCLLRQTTDGVATLTLNRPAARNSLSLALLRALHDEIHALAEDDTARVVIVEGAGPAFCAGHDLRELQSAENPAEIFTICSAMMQSLANLPKPVIAQVHGMATAAGCQLVASCDLAVAADDSRFATPGVNIGLFCSTPMVPLTRNVGRKAAMRMLLTGDPVDAQTAFQWGLISEIVPRDQLAERTMALARQLAARSPRVLALGKQCFQRQQGMPIQVAYQFANEVMAENLAMPEAQEGIAAFLEKRPPKF